MCKFLNKAVLVVSVLSIVVACGGAEERKAKYKERAEAYFADKNWEKASVEIRNVLQIDPKDAESYYMLGVIHEKNNELSKAYTNFSKAVELDPENWDASEKLAGMYLLSAQKDKAQELVSSMLTKEPGNHSAKALQAAIYGRDGKADEALELVNEILADDPGHAGAAVMASAIYIHKQQRDTALDVLERAINKNPEQIEVLSALVQFHAGRDNNKAAEYLEKITKVEPENMQHKVGLATFYSQTNQNDKAESVLRDIVAEDPRDSSRQLLLADYLLSQNNGELAIEGLKKTIDTYQDEPSLKLALAHVYHRAEMLDESVKQYNSIIDNYAGDPIEVLAKKNLARVYYFEKKLDDAGALVKEVLGDVPQDVDALKLRALILMASETPDHLSVISDLRSVIKSDPDSLEAHELLAEAHIKNKEPDLARDSLRKAVRLAAGNPTPYVRLARFYLQNDKDPSSAEEVLNSFKSNKQDMSVMLAMVDVYHATRNDAKLLDLFSRMKAAFPDDAIPYIKAGEYYASKMQYEKAIDEFATARAKAPDDYLPAGALAKAYVESNDISTALDVLNAFLDGSPNNINALSMKANVLATANRHDELASVAQIIKEVHPNSPVGYQLSGSYYLLKKQYKEGRDELIQAYKKSANKGQLIGEILKTFLADNKANEAMQWLSAEEKANPGQGIYAYHKGGVMKLQQKYDEAEKYFNEALPKLNERAGVYVNLSEIRYLQGDSIGAIDILKKGLAENDSSNDLRLKLASLYEASGRYDEALIEYERLYKQLPTNIVVINNLAALLTDYKGDPASLNRAADLVKGFSDVNHPAIIDTIGWLHYKSGDVEKALPYLKKAVELAPDNHQLNYHLGMAYYKHGDTNAAKKYLNEAFSQGRDIPWSEEGKEVYKELTQ